MINEKKLDDLCVEAKMKRVKLATEPTWVSKDGLEGIEIHNEKGQQVLRSFWVKDGSRVYDEPSSEAISHIIEHYSDQIKEKKDEKEKMKEINTEGENGVILLPERITPLLLEKWKKLSTFDRMLMFQKTAKELIKTKPKGKTNVSYVEGNVMQQEANIAFLFAWKDRIEGFHYSDKAVACYGYVSAMIDGIEVIHSAVGVDIQEYKRDSKEPVFTQEELMKNAHTDMIKKALSKFGFNSDVYRGEV